MPVSKLSLKVLNELDLDTYSPKESKINIAISSRSQYLVDLKAQEALYLSNLQKLLAYAGSSLNLSKNTQYVSSIKDLISRHNELFNVLSASIDPHTNYVKPLAEIYCFRDISQWALKFNRNYIRYSQHYDYNPFLPEYTSNLLKLPFIRYKALVKLLNKFYHLSLNFENSLPNFQFSDISLSYMFVEITKNFEKSAKFSSIQWNIVKDFLNNEKLYLDYFSINFTSTRSIETLQKTSDASFLTNHILKRDYFEFEFSHPWEKTTSKKMIELVLLSNKEVNDFNRIHNSHTARSLEKLAKIESKQDFLASANSEAIDTIFNSLANIDQDNEDATHKREFSQVSMVSTDAVEESYKGSLNFRFAEIAALAICAVDSNIGRNLIFPKFKKGDLSLKSINKSINELVLVYNHKRSDFAPHSITIKISCLDDEQFNVWTPFIKELFPYETIETPYFQHHHLLKSNLELHNALGINLSSLLLPIAASDNTAHTKDNSDGSANIEPLNIEKAPSPALTKRTSSSSKQSSRIIIDIPELDAFLKQLEADCDISTPRSDNFHFDEISYSNGVAANHNHNNHSNDTPPLASSGMTKSSSRLSTISKSRKVSNFDDILKEDNESDWATTCASTNTSISVVPSGPREIKSYYNDNHNNLSVNLSNCINGPSPLQSKTPQQQLLHKQPSTSSNSGSISIKEFKYLKMPPSHSANSNISNSIKEEHENVDAAHNNEKSNDNKNSMQQKPFASAFRTPAIVMMDKSNSKSTDYLLPAKLPGAAKSNSSTPALSLAPSEHLNNESSGSASNNNNKQSSETKPAKFSLLKKKPQTGNNAILLQKSSFRRLFSRAIKSKKIESYRKRESFLPQAAPEMQQQLNQIADAATSITAATAANTNNNPDMASPITSADGFVPVVSKQIPEGPVISKKRAQESVNLSISPSQRRLSSYQNSMKRRSFNGYNDPYSISKSNTNKPSISKSGSRNSIGKGSVGKNSNSNKNNNNKLLSGMQLEISKQQKLFDELLGSTPAAAGVAGASNGGLGSNEASPAASEYYIPNNYSVSALQITPSKNNDEDNLNIVGQDSKLNLSSPAKIVNGIDHNNIPHKLNFNKVQITDKSPSSTSFLSQSTSISNSSFVTGLTHQETSTNDLNVILEHSDDENEATVHEKLDAVAAVADANDHQDDAVVSDEEDIPIPKEEFLSISQANSAFTTPVKTVQNDSLVTPMAANSVTSTAPTTVNSSMMSNNADTSMDTSESCSNVNYLSNFGKEYEPRFYSPEKEKKGRKSILGAKISLKRKKSLDFEMVTKIASIKENRDVDATANGSLNSPISATSVVVDHHPEAGSALGGPTVRNIKSLNNLNANESKVSVATIGAGTCVQRANSTHTNKSTLTNLSIISSLNNSSRETITKSKETLTKSKDTLNANSAAAAAAAATNGKLSTFDSFKNKVTSPLAKSFKKDKNLKKLKVNTSFAAPNNGASTASTSAGSVAPNSGIPTPVTASSSTSSFLSLTERCMANLENCVVIHKEYVMVSLWKKDHWALIEAEPLYLEVAISIEQSYLHFFKSNSMRSVSSIKPFLALPINSSCYIMRNSNNVDVQVKSFDEVSKKSILVCLRSGSVSSANILVQALEYALKDHTKNSLMKTRQQLSNNSSHSFFSYESSASSNNGGRSVTSDSISSTSAPPSEVSAGSIGKDASLLSSSATAAAIAMALAGPPPQSAKSNLSFTIPSPISETGSEYLMNQIPIAGQSPNASMLSINQQMSSLSIDNKNSATSVAGAASNNENLNILTTRKIRFHKKSSISGKWAPITIAKLQVISSQQKQDQFRIIINEYKTDKILIDSVINGSKCQRIGQTGVCIIVQSKDGITFTNKPNYLIESRNEVEADDLFEILAQHGKPKVVSTL